jgi:hypothetical protein
MKLPKLEIKNIYLLEPKRQEMNTSKVHLTPKVLGVFFIKTASKQSLFKTR